MYDPQIKDGSGNCRNLKIPTLHYTLAIIISLRRCCHFANSSELGPMSLYHQNISKNLSHDLTLLPLTTTVTISLTISTSKPGHDHKCETVR